MRREFYVACEGPGPRDRIDQRNRIVNSVLLEMSNETKSILSNPKQKKKPPAFFFQYFIFGIFVNKKNCWIEESEQDLLG